MWNSNQRKSQHRKLTQKKKILPTGLEHAIAEISPLPVWGKDCFGAITFYKAVVVNREMDRVPKKKKRGGGGGELPWFHKHIQHLRSCLSRVIRQLHFFTIDLLEAFLTIDISVGENAQFS